MTARAGAHIPQSDVIAAAIRAQAAYIAAERRRHIAYYSAHGDVADALAVRARHGMNLLPEQSAPLIRLSLISARRTPICLLPRHLLS